MARLKQPHKTKIRIAIKVLRAKNGRWPKLFADRLERILRAPDKNVVSVIRANLGMYEFNWLQAQARGLKEAARQMRKARNVDWMRAAGRELRQDAAALRDIQRTVKRLQRIAAED